MLLAHLKQIAEKELNTAVSDCVIGVPSYFTDKQRHAYLDAAAIAGLKPLRLMHDSAATALGYGIYKSDTETPINVVFVDIGHCDTQISVVSFKPGRMQVLAHAFDANLGGRDFDEVLFDYFSEQFKGQYNIDVSSNVRASVRLRVACEKLKKVLSANAEAPLSIECLMDEKDVRGFIKREEFESLSSGLLERVLIPCKKVLTDVGLSMDRIDSVELIGSGSRIPAIAKILGRFFRKEPSRTLNASECVARGCALQCAMLSPIFRVREYEVQDSFPFTVGFLADGGPVSTSASNILFQRGQPVPSVKMFTFLRTSTFHLEIFYADPNELPPGAASKLCSLKVGPFQVSQGERSKVKLKFRLNLHGIVSVDSAWLVEDAVNDPLSRDTSQHNMDKMDTEYISDAQRDTRGAYMDSGTSAQSDSGSFPSVDRTRKETPSRKHEIPVDVIIGGGLSKTQLLAAQEEEQQLANQDKLMEQTKDKKNALESYVYEIRNKLFERYRSFASESEREGLSNNLQKTEDWLYEDGDDETENVYTNKMEELRKLVDPIESRFKDEEARAQATREFLNCIVEYRMAVQSMPTYEREAVINECNNAEHWLRDISQQQESLPKNANPALWSHEIKKKMEAFNICCRNIMRHKNSPSEDTRSANHLNTPDDTQTD